STRGLLRTDMRRYGCEGRRAALAATSCLPRRAPVSSMLRLFGAPSLDCADGPMAGRAAQGARLALLALLALARGRPVMRDRIIALLWPESPSERARPQLSDTLYILRSALGDDAVRTVGDEVVLNPTVVPNDVELFEQLLREDRLEEAVQLRT